MKKILTRAATIAAFFLLAVTVLCGCDDNNVQGKVDACMQNFISAGKVNDTTRVYYQQVCYQLVTQKP